MGKVVSKVTRRNQACKRKGAIVPTTITSLCQCGPGRVTIGGLPDDILLIIFYFCQEDQVNIMENWWLPLALRLQPPAWYRLVQICQRWRNLVLGSPIHLNLYLVCNEKTPVRDMLHIWPHLPILILSHSDDVVDNLIAALEHRDRVRQIHIELRSSDLERFATVMQESFPALTYLDLDLDEPTPPLPDTFLGGSAPHLRYLSLRHIPFPGLPKLLLTTNDLVTLHLFRIPHTGYFSPETIVAALSNLTRLQHLNIGFASPASRPPQSTRRPPPQTRAALPSLTYLVFQGVSEHLEGLISLIDVNVLYLNITCFNQLIFDFRHLPWLISHSGMLGSSGYAKLVFQTSTVELKLFLQGVDGVDRWLFLGNGCEELDWQVSYLAQICSQFSFLLSTIEQLDIVDHNNLIPLETDDVSRVYSNPKVDMDNAQWLELFQPFIAVHTLRISRHFQSLIMSAFQELTVEMTTEVLPALHTLYLEEHEPSGPEHQAIQRFVTARQHSGHPVAIHRLKSPLRPWSR
jgi:hypothetical protein